MRIRAKWRAYAGFPSLGQDVVLIPRRERGPALNSGVRACFGSRRRKVILKKYFALEKSDRNVPVTEKNDRTCRNTASAWT